MALFGRLFEGAQPWESGNPGNSLENPFPAPSARWQPRSGHAPGVVSPSDATEMPLYLGYQNTPIWPTIHNGKAKALAGALAKGSWRVWAMWPLPTRAALGRGIGATWPYGQCHSKKAIGGGDTTHASNDTIRSGSFSQLRSLGFLLDCANIGP
jgi:hypothetical protein